MRIYTVRSSRIRYSTRVALAAGFALGALLPAVWAQSSPASRLRAPFHVGGDDGLNILVLVPEMESAISLGTGVFRMDLGSDLIENDFKNTSGRSYFRMRGGAVESHFRLGYGILESLDVSAELMHVAYLGHVQAVNDGESFFGADADTHAGVSDPVLALKYQFHEGKTQKGTGLALRVASKMPLGSEENLHSTDAFDVAFSLLGSLEMGRGTCHANIGYTLVGDQSAFRSEAEVDLKNTMSFGVGYLYEFIEEELAVGGQLFAYTNPYRDVVGNVKGFDGPPANAILGVRYFGNEYLHVDLGTMFGITSDAPNFGMFLNLVVQH